LTPQPPDQDGILVDVTSLALSDILRNSDGPLLASLMRIDEGIDDEATACFADGIA
jgi:hypothetical protein